jgi:hypothetical protein
MRDQATFCVTAGLDQGGRGPPATALRPGGCTMCVRFASDLGGRWFSGSNSRPAWRVDLTAVSAERKRQEPSMSISVAIRVTDASGSPQTLAGRRTHA